MKRVAIIVAALVVVTVALLTLLARREKPLAYDPAKEVTVAGTVQEVKEFYCPLSDDRGTHLVLKTDNGDIMVHVALARFLRRQEIVFKTGDRVEVTGSKPQSDVVIARQITRGPETFILRDTGGNPAWQ